MTDEPCSSPIHQWTPRRSTGSWFCTQCGLIVFQEPTGTGPDGRLPNGKLPRVRYHKGSGGFKTKHLSKLDLLQRLYARDGRRCWWCGRVLLAMDEIRPVTDGHLPENYPTVDHLQPQSKGGSNAILNLVASCPGCNARRGNAIARYVPADQPTELAQAVTCPDCEEGVWLKSDHRVCPTCEGSGIIGPARAVELFKAQRTKARAAVASRNEARLEVARLREVLGSASRRDVGALVDRQKEIIRALADRILTLKVELAEAGGGDIEQLIPRADDRERALHLVRTGETTPRRRSS